VLGRREAAPYRLLPALAAGLLVVGAAWPATAERPTEPESPYRYDPTDVLAFHDDPSGLVRVHYSAAGPTAVPLADGDGDGVPEFVERVAQVAAAALLYYEQQVGLRSPLSEASMGLAPLGGSEALDVYLVDFAGVGDGHFDYDACSEVPAQCAGFLLVDNDFAGYGYPSQAFAIDLVVPHELFHGIQAAYEAYLPVWISEGTAVWGTSRFDPLVSDLIPYADAYLAEAWRSVDKPPPGPVPAFAYGTGLLFDFLATRHDPAFIGEVLTATVATTLDPIDPRQAIAAALQGRGDTLADAWLAFASANLASGSRAGATSSHSYAGQLAGVVADAEGARVEDLARYSPLAALYHRLDHPGGPVWFAVEQGYPGLWFALHPVASGAADGPVAGAAFTWEGSEARAAALDGGRDFPAGGYWLVGAYAVITDQSAKTRVCLGDQATAEVCAPAPVPEPQPELGPDAADAAAAERAEDAGTEGVAAEVGGADVGATPGPGPGDGGGCQGGPRTPSGAPWQGGGALILAALAALLALRRRREAR
jgi:hypothetical protein